MSKKLNVYITKRERKRELERELELKYHSYYKENQNYLSFNENYCNIEELNDYFNWKLKIPKSNSNIILPSKKYCQKNYFERNLAKYYNKEKMENYYRQEEFKTFDRFYEIFKNDIN